MGKIALNYIHFISNVDITTRRNRAVVDVFENSLHGKGGISQ